MTDEESVIHPRGIYIRHQLSEQSADMVEMRPDGQRKAHAVREREPTSVPFQQNCLAVAIAATHLDSFPSPRHKSEQVCRTGGQLIWDLGGHSRLDV